MSTRGRKPKPTNLKILEGNPGKRPLNMNEPKPDNTMPEMPKWLNAEAKKEWKRVAPELHRIGLLTMADRTALAAYCQSYGKWVAAEKAIQEKGLTFQMLTPEGEVRYEQQVPEVGIANTTLNQIRAFCSLFGLDPSSRSKMQLPNEKSKEDAFAKKLKSKIG